MQFKGGGPPFGGHPSRARLGAGALLRVRAQGQASGGRDFVWPAWLKHVGSGAAGAMGAATVGGPLWAAHQFTNWRVEATRTQGQISALEVSQEKSFQEVKEALASVKESQASVKETVASVKESLARLEGRLEGLLTPKNRR